jgi:hypothetical protein
MKYLLIVVYCLYLRGYEKRLIGIKENVMKKFLLLSVLLAFGIATVAEAQLREDLSKSRDYTGAVFQTQQPTTSALGNFLNNINMEMSHSYSMNFGSIGGQFQNLNAYTNHLTFDFSENMTGYFDVSVLHSPFGNSYMNMGNNSLGSRIIIDRAQLDYQISPNTSLSIQFSQRPYYSPFGMGSMYGPRNHHYLY